MLYKLFSQIFHELLQSLLCFIGFKFFVQIQTIGQHDYHKIYNIY